MRSESMQFAEFFKRKEKAECRQRRRLRYSTVAVLWNTTLCFLTCLSADDLDATAGEAGSAKLVVGFSFFIYLHRIWKLALPSYEIRCSDAGSFISKLALRFPLGTAAELLALISRRSNSIFSCLRPLPFFVKLSLIISSTEMMCPSFFFYILSSSDLLQFIYLSF